MTMNAHLAALAVSVAGPALAWYRDVPLSCSCPWVWWRERGRFARVGLDPDCRWHWRRSDEDRDFWRARDPGQPPD